MTTRPATDRAELLVVSHSGARAGAPMVMLRFLEWLQRNTTVGADVLLLHGGSMEREFTPFGARIVGGGQSRLWMLQHGLHRLGLHRPAAALSLARLGPPLWRRRNIPVVLLNSVGSVPAMRWLPERGQRIVLYVHELDAGFKGTVGRAVWDRHSPRIDRFVSCSEAVTEMLVERAGVPRSKITRVHGFIDRPSVEPERTAHIRRQLRIPDRALVVGACGRPDWRKGPDVFVRLAHTLASRRPDLDLRFVWLGGPLAGAGERIEHDIAAAGLADRFHLVDETPFPHGYMSNFDVFCLTSREDPYPLSMLEAGALGVPVVSFANGGSTELAAAGGGRPLVEVVPYLAVEAMADAVGALLDDRRRREAAGARLRDHVRAHHLTDVGAPALFDVLVEQRPALLDRRNAPTRGARAA